MKGARRKRERIVTNCIFCSRTDLDREHVWPTWSHEFVRKGRQSGYTIQSFQSSPSHPRIRGETAFKQRHGDVTTMKLKVVCKKHCNNGWMSRLETHAKPFLVPLMTGRPIILNKYNQEIIATWIAMKLMVCEFSDPSTLVMPVVERSLLMGRRRPPDIMKIWIADYQQATWSNAYARFSYGVGVGEHGKQIKPEPQMLAGAKNILSQSLLAGRFFIQAVTIAIAGVEYQTPRHASLGLRQIWPFEREFAWPPIMPLSDTALNFAATDLEQLTRRLPFYPGTPRKS
jgi:hypothetical protein